VARSEQRVFNLEADFNSRLHYTRQMIQRCGSQEKKKPNKGTMRGGWKDRVGSSWAKGAKGSFMDAKCRRPGKRLSSKVEGELLDSIEIKKLELERLLTSRKKLLNKAKKKRGSALLLGEDFGTGREAILGKKEGRKALRESAGGKGGEH